MSLDEAMSKLGIENESTAVDVTLKLLEKESAVYHTEIKNVKTMNALRVMMRFCELKGRKLDFEIWKTLYEGNIDLMVGYKRKRAGELKEILKAQMQMLGQPLDEKKGWFGRK